MLIIFGFFAFAAAHHLRHTDAMRLERRLLLADPIPFEYTNYTPSDCLGEELTEWVPMGDAVACQQECDNHSHCTGFGWREGTDSSVCKLFEATITATSQALPGHSCIVVSRDYRWVKKFCR